MEFLNLRNTWVSFFNVSFKMHADVIAGTQNNQIQIGIKQLGILWINM